MTSNEFEQEVKDLVNSYFPDAKYYKPIDFHASVNAFGLSESEEPASEPIDTCDFRVNVENVSKSSAISFAIDELRKLRFYKSPKFILCRSIELGENAYFSTDVKTHTAYVRFTLGY